MINKRQNPFKVYQIYIFDIFMEGCRIQENSTYDFVENVSYSYQVLLLKTLNLQVHQQGDQRMDSSW